MKSFLLKTINILAVAVLLYGCSGDDGEPGPSGQDGQDGTPGADGADGATALITTAAASESQCSAGGFIINVGVDTNNNGALDDDEISATEVLCNGADGSEGSDGNTALINTAVEPEGDNCSNGGFKVETGVDDNGNGTLDTEEIDQTVFICNGEDFLNQLNNPLEPLVTTFGQFKSIAVETLVSSIDELPTSDGGTMHIGGSADGAGMVVGDDGNLILMVNFEDHYSIGRFVIDPSKFASDRTERGDLVESIISADYVLNSSVGDFARQCSGTMWEQAIHGGSQDMYFSASENWNHVVKGFDPHNTVPNPSDADMRLNAMGHFNWENAVPLPQAAYPGSTVFVGGDDDYKFNGNGGGSIVLYFSNAGDDDFTGGQPHVMRLANQTVEGVTITDGAIDGEPADEGDIIKGVPYEVEFVALPDGLSDVLGNGAPDFTSLAEYDAASVDLNALEFVRVEDLDYGKGSVEANRTMYFSITGRGPGRGTPNDWGSGYKLELDPADPTKGTLTKILTGNLDEEGALAALQSPDNICVTDNYIYWQEDPNSFARGHQAYIWQTDLDGNNPQAVLQIDLNSALDNIEGTDSDGFNGEFGALIDISDKIGEQGTFILCLQPHYWTDPAYAGVDGHDNGFGTPGGFAPREDQQGSQLVVLRGLPR